jgi:hypothetical protein
MPILSPPPLPDLLEAERRRHPAICWESPWSTQSGKNATNVMYLKELIALSKMSAYHGLEQRYAALFDELAKLRSLDRDWDTFESEPPSENAIQAAKGALMALKAVRAEPTAVRPSAEGGVGICFVSGNAYAHLEFLNEGSVHALAYSDLHRPESWEVDRDRGLVDAWRRIHAYLQP